MITLTREEAKQVLVALVLYRRANNDKQPCDAEKMLHAKLEEKNT
jgi:hypothetical protein